MTTREKRLVIGCGVFLLATAYILYFLVPQLRAVEALRTGIAESSQNYALNQIYAGRVKHLGQEKQELIKKVASIRRIYPPVMKQSDILFAIYLLASEANLKIVGVSIADTVPLIPDSTVNQPAAAALSTGAAPAAATDSKVKDPRMTSLMQELGLAGNGGYSAAAAANSKLQIVDGQGFMVPAKIAAVGSDAQVKSFFARLNRLPNQVLVKDYSVVLKEPDLLEIEATLSFYGIADSYAASHRLFTDNGPPTRPGNLFSGSPETLMARTPAPETIEPDSQLMTNILDGYDFSMRVVPYGNNMAPSTVSIAARGLINNDKAAVIYGDNPREERVELAIYAKDNKYYCKYRTSSESFPDKNYQEIMEFKPQGSELKFIIDSTPRKFAGDLSSVNLIIANNTALRLVITELNDDTNQPRLKVTVTTGRYKILRNAPLSAADLHDQGSGHR